MSHLSHSFCFNKFRKSDLKLQYRSKKLFLGELQSKQVELKQTERSKKRAEEDARRKIEDEKRRLMGKFFFDFDTKIFRELFQNTTLADTERQIKDTRSRAARDLMSKEEKLNRIRGILDGKKLTQSAGSPLRTQTSSPALKSVRI